MHVQSHVAISADGVPIHYDVQGNGATALVFVHGWCCNRRFWEPQVEHFASHYTVVCIDVGGHGASGRDRPQWTVPAFGQDIVAVVQQQGLDQVLLIGHSMGGSWIVEAARHLPSTVIGVIGVDAWPNTEQAPPPAQVAQTMAPFRTNFVDAMRAFAQSLFVPTSNPALVEHAAATMSATPPHIAIGVREAVIRALRRLPLPRFQGSTNARNHESLDTTTTTNSDFGRHGDTQAVNRCADEIRFP
jgi:pimeloyl-ACP methyl ester carboxylesterase